jgi:hypothetical protein
MPGIGPDRALSERWIFELAEAGVGYWDKKMGIGVLSSMSAIRFAAILVADL